MRRWIPFVAVASTALVIGVLIGLNLSRSQPLTLFSTTTKDPRDLALAPGEMPNGFTLFDRVERVARDIDKDALLLGWAKGYLVRYSRGSLLNSTVIEQLISIYPRENMTKAFELAIARFEGADRLSDPRVGERSAAFRIVEGFSRQYVIIFQKGNVHETIAMSGNVTDFELLKEIARKAEAKI